MPSGPFYIVKNGRISILQLSDILLHICTPCLWPPHAKSWLIGKDSDAGRDWGQEEKGTTEDEMAGWHHWLDGRESEWSPGVGDGQGGLACCDSWGRKESDTTERLNWTELKATSWEPRDKQGNQSAERGRDLSAVTEPEKRAQVLPFHLHSKAARGHDTSHFTPRGIRNSERLRNCSKVMELVNRANDNSKRNDHPFFL